MTGGSGGNVDLGALGHVAQHAGLEIDDELVAVVDEVGVALDDRQAGVDRVAVEDAREALREHRLGVAVDEHERRLLAARAHAEVLAGHQEAALGLHLLVVVRVELLHGVHRHGLHVGGLELVLAADDVVGVDVVAVLEGLRLEFHVWSLLSLAAS